MHLRSYIGADSQYPPRLRDSTPATTSRYDDAFTKAWEDLTGRVLEG